MVQTTFLPQGYTEAYEQYFTQAVERPLRRQRARALQDLYEQMAQRGILRSGVGMYPITQLEQNLQEVLGREGARLALAQAERQTQLEEMARQRAWQEEMLNRQIEFQRQILDEQRRLAEQQMWGQLAGALLGTVLMPPLGVLGGLGATALTRLVAPQTYLRQQALENLLLQYYQSLLGTPTTQTSLTAGVNVMPISYYYPPTTLGTLTIK